MVHVLLATVFVGVLVHRRIKKRRARKRAIKLAAIARTGGSPMAVRFPEDEVINIGRESTTSSSRASIPPPYSTPSPRPFEPLGGPPHVRVRGFEHSPRTYATDKPPSYNATVLQVQNS